MRTIRTDGDTQTVMVEPEWDEHERVLMLGLSAYEDSLCPVCNGPVEECQSPDAEWEWTGAPPVRCHKKDAILRYQEKSGATERPAALLYGAKRRDQ